jgi:hypothetical protein
MERPLPFSVNKKVSLDIIRDLSKKLLVEKGINIVDINEKHGKKNDSKYCLNYKMEDQNHPSKAVSFTHKLNVIELDISEIMTKELGNVIDNYYSQILNTKIEEYTDCDNPNLQYIVSSEVEIYNCTTDGNTIDFEAYLYDVADCDISYPSFTYDETLKCWIIRDSFWDAENGIDCNGNIVILDFSEYFE